YITPIAVKAAADPQQCPADGEPWTVKKFYVESGFQDNSEPTLRINTGQYDPILGRTYFEIAMEGRSLHRSQGEGRIEFHGDSFSGLSLAENRASQSFFPRIFAGIDTRSGVVLPESPSLDDLASAMKQLPVNASAVPNLIATARYSAELQIDALASSETVVPGDDLMVSVKAFKPENDAKIVAVNLSAPSGWAITRIDPPKQNNAAYNNREVAA